MHDRWLRKSGATTNKRLLILLLQIDWKAEENRPVKPKLLGTKVYKDYAVKDIIDYIDWNPFFQVCLQSAILDHQICFHRSMKLPLTWVDCLSSRIACCPDAYIHASALFSNSLPSQRLEAYL